MKRIKNAEGLHAVRKGADEGVKARVRTSVIAITLSLIVGLAQAGIVPCKTCQGGCSNGSGTGGAGKDTGIENVAPDGNSWTEYERYWTPKNDCNGFNPFSSCTTTSSKSSCYTEKTRFVWIDILGVHYGSWTPVTTIKTPDCV